MMLPHRFLSGLLFCAFAGATHAGLVVVGGGDGGHGRVDMTGVLTGKRIVTVAAGANHFLALSADGQIFARGASTRGQLGNGVSGDGQGMVATKPGPELAGRPFTAISAGFDTSYALTTDGQVFAWGLNHFGQLGNGHHDLTSYPQAVITNGALAGRKVTAISAGMLHCLALTTDGQVLAWGLNEFGQLGDGTTNNSSVPVAVDVGGALAGKTVTAIAAGASGSLALTAAGEIFGWGYNQSGALGDGTNLACRSPVAVDLSGVPSGAKVTSVAAGGDFNLALMSDGRVLAWGGNDFGQLGDGTTETRLKPVAVDFSGALAGRPLVAIAAGAGHSLARTADGLMFAWGYNQFEQLNVPGVNVSHLLPTAMDTEGLLSGLVVTGFVSGPTAFSTLFLTTEAARTALTLSSGGLQFSVIGEPFSDYLLQGAASLTPPVTWLPLAPLTTDAAGTATYTAADAVSPAFWRIVPAP